MDSPNPEHKVIALLREHIKDPTRPIHREDRLFDLLDSLDLVEVVMALEEELEMSVPDKATEEMKTVGDLIDYIDRHAAGPRQAADDQRAA